MQTFKRVFALVMALLMLALSGCTQPQPGSSSTNSSSSSATVPSSSQGKPDDEYTLPKEEGQGRGP